MAKQRIQNYVFLPGVSKSSNAYPNAYSLIDNNKDFIKAETLAYINAQIALDNASNLYPNAVTLLTNNKQFIIDEIIAWIAYRVTNSISPFAGYSYNTTSCRRDTGYLIDALIYDIRYGGNEKTINIAKSFWQGGTAQLISPTQEIAGFNQIFTIITDYILPKTAYSSQQSPVTSTQNVSGTAAEAGVATSVTTNLKPIISNVVSGGLSTLPSVSYSVKNYAGYIYDSAKCNRDIGLVLDAYLNDIRYGGNAKTRNIASRFWKGTVPQLSGDRNPEITAQNWIRDLITNTILPQAAYTQLQLGETIYRNAGITYEPASTARVTTLSNVLTSVITNGLTSLPALIPGVSTIRLQGKYELDTLLLITNTSKNEILYSFTDPNLAVTVTTSTGYVSNDYWQDDDFASFRNIADYVTEIVLAADTSTHSLNDDIQIFVEAKEMKVRPYDFGTDAIERHRVAQAQSMIDADFEYGLQPTKWQAIGISRGYPSVYEVPGTDTPVVTAVTDGSTGTGGVGESLITVTTSGPHSFTVGQPFTIKSLANSVSGFSRAEGTFLVNTVATTTTFTYYATAKVGTNNQVLASSYTQLRKAAFYTGATIGTPTISVDSNGTTGSFTSKWITATASDQIAFTGSAPPIGAPLTVSGIPSGSQITGVVGTGGATVTANIETSVNISDTAIVVANATGILEGMAVDNGSGTSIFVSGIVGNTINFTGPVTTARRGNTQTYAGVSGVNLTSAGASAVFTVTRVAGAYSSITATSAGTSYRVGDRIKILGSALGGASPANDAIVTVTQLVGGLTSVLDSPAGISVATITGTSISGNATFADLVPDANTGIGINATFTVNRIAGAYSVTCSAGGNGYVAGDVLTIYGTQLGGTTPTNNLTITITGTIGALDSVYTFDISGTSVTSDATFTAITGTLVAPVGTGATFDITRSSAAYTTAVVNNTGSNYYLGERIKILGTSLGGTTPTNDVTLTITAVASNQISTIEKSSATAISGVTLPFWSAATFSEASTGSIADGTTVSVAAIARMIATFVTAHGLVPGSSIIVDISSTGTNHALARGPFYVETVPSATTLTYTARSTGTIDVITPMSGTIYTRPDSFFIHRPYDGGVQLGTGGPQHGAQAIRMSKKYIRYQSGKGINYCTGALFAPSFSIQYISADATSIGSYITVTTDDVDHGCQVGGVIEIHGIETKGYNNTYTVADVVSERVLKVQAVSVLADITGTLSTDAQLSIKKWHGATVRAGTFDDQNGIYFQYDGQDFAVGRRSSTFQLAGTINISKDSNAITGTNTRFRDQARAGDRIVIKGMTHIITSITSQTTMTVNPDYRGASNAVAAKACLVEDFVIKQRDFNIDRIDGTGPSGYNIDVTKMQMIGMQWSWYAVGFIDFMLRGSDGNFVFFHRIRNSNVNTEAYMRTGNNPVRYEVINESARDKLDSSVTSSQTTISLSDAGNFPNESGIVMIDNELIAFSGKSNNTLIGCTRAAPMTNFVGGAQRTFRGSTAATHEYNTGVILVSNTISPIISHWGSAMLTDGLFDEDRGYIFNYAATNLSVTTTKQTAFLIRLAPSVSNAIVGDLGDRELLNRAQLLLKGIEITADSGTGGIVVEGVLNPQNYPTSPTNINWAGLQSSAAGGQPSFAQIAPGGSVSWSSGITQTTAAVTTLAFPTGSLTASTVPFGGNALVNGANYFGITQATYDAAIASGLAVGDTISGTGIQSNTTITSIAFWYNSGGTTYYIVYMSQNANSSTATTGLTVTKKYAVQNTSTLLFSKTNWENGGAAAGTEVSDSLFPAGTFVSTATLVTYFSTQYYRVTLTQTSTSTTITPGTTTVTFKFGQPPYALPGETVFSFVASPGTNSALDLGELKELTNTTLGGRGCYPNGPDVLAINVYKAAGSAVPCNIVLRWGEAQA